jgi:hypothetical protein
MAGFVVSPNTLRVLWHVSTHGRPELYVTHAEYSIAGPLNPNIAETIFSAFKAQFGAASLSVMHAALTFEGVGVIDLRGPNNPEIESTGASETGTSIETPLPDQSCCVVTLRTAFAGRSFRGRVYTFGWTASGVTAQGTISDNVEATALQMVTAMKAGIQAGGGQLAIRSPALPERPAHDGSTLPAKDFAITPVTTFLVRDRIWDTNRRRIDTLHR